MTRCTSFWLFTILLLPASTIAGEAPSSIALQRLTTDGHFKQRPAWSPDGKWLAFTRHRAATILLHVISADGSQERRLTSRKEPEYDAVWSPDGKRLAATLDKTAPNQGDLEVYTFDPQGDELRPVAITQGQLSHEESPAWSPDGQWIAYTSTRDGNQELYAARADGTEPRRLTNDPALDAHPTWSPDGRRIAFTTNRWGDWELATVDPEGKNLTRLTQSPGLDDYPAWSPDGKQLAFASNRDGNFEIYLLEVATGTVRNVTSHESIDHYPAWTPDGRLTFISNRDGGFDIYVTTRKQL